MADKKDKYQLLNELQFQLGLAHRYATIVEHRVSNRMEMAPYLNLLAVAMADASKAHDALVPLLNPEPVMLTKEDVFDLVHGSE